MVVDDDGSLMGLDPGLLESELLADTLSVAMSTGGEFAEVFVEDFDDVVAGQVLRVLEDLADVVSGADGGFGLFEGGEYFLLVAQFDPAGDDAVDFVDMLDPTLRRLEAWVVGGVFAAAQGQDPCDDGG